MIRKIILENFMAHARTELELAAGLTVIVGPNNGGKSAIVAALDALANNESGDWMVRHGAKECRVTVVIEPDAQDPLDAQPHRLAWQRRGGTVSYDLDGQEFTRLRGKPPPELSPLLRLDPVVIEKEDLNVHVAAQKQPVFLIDQSAARLAAFFAASSDTALLIAMQKRFRERVKEAKNRHLELQKRALALEAQLAQLAPLPELRQALTRLETLHAQRVQGLARQQRLSDCMTRLRSQQGQRHRLTGQRHLLEALQTPPKLKDLGPGLKLVERWRADLAHRQRLARQQQLLKRLASPPSIKDVGPGLVLRQRWHSARNQVQRLQREANVLAQLVTPPQIRSTAILQHLATRLRDLLGRRQHLQRAARALAELTPPPKLHDVARLRPMATGLRDRALEAAGHRTTLTALACDLQQLATGWSASAAETWLHQLRPPRPTDPALIPVVIKELERRAEEARTVDPFLAVFIWGQLLLHYADHLAATPAGAELPGKLRDALDAAAQRLAQAEATL